MDMPKHPLIPLASRCIAALLSFCYLVEVHGQDGTPEEEQTRRALAGIPILPSKTDPQIKDFDMPHYAQVDRDIVIRHVKDRPQERRELLVWLTGTGGQGRGAGEFCQLATKLGYHVVKVMYPNSIPATSCQRDPNPQAFELFRMAIIQGGKYGRITVSRTDSIEHRLIKLLELLKQTRGRENWGQFLTAEGDLKWDTLALAGQSQGGGHALLMAMKHRVARVICTGAPKDRSLATKGPAAWLRAESATPKDRIFTFNHQQDHQGCTPEEQWANLQALGLDAYGPLVNVDETPSPFKRSRMLTTNFPGGKLESSPAHTSVSANAMAEKFQPVWTYMLTEAAEKE